MSSSILTGRARIAPEKALQLLKCYAERMEPPEVAKVTGLSLNSIYKQYRRIRERLVATGYYDNGALSLDEAGLGEVLKERLRGRKRIRDEDIYAHAAELIDWADEWPPKLTLKHLRKIIDLTGPLDQPKELSETEFERLNNYIRYARTELIYDRASASKDSGEFQKGYVERAKAALDEARRAYRAAGKRVERKMR